MHHINYSSRSSDPGHDSFDNETVAQLEDTESIDEGEIDEDGSDIASRPQTAAAVALPRLTLESISIPADARVDSALPSPQETMHTKPDARIIALLKFAELLEIYDPSHDSWIGVPEKLISAVEYVRANGSVHANEAQDGCTEQIAQAEERASSDKLGCFASLQAVAESILVVIEMLFKMAQEKPLDHDWSTDCLTVSQASKLFRNHPPHNDRYKAMMKQNSNPSEAGRVAGVLRMINMLILQGIEKDGYGAVLHTFFSDQIKNISEHDLREVIGTLKMSLTTMYAHCQKGDLSSDPARNTWQELLVKRKTDRFWASSKYSVLGKVSVTAPHYQPTSLGGTIEKLRPVIACAETEHFLYGHEMMTFSGSDGETCPVDRKHCYVEAVHISSMPEDPRRWDADRIVLTGNLPPDLRSGSTKMFICLERVSVPKNSPIAPDDKEVRVHGISRAIFRRKRQEFDERNRKLDENSNRSSEEDENIAKQILARTNMAPVSRAPGNAVATVPDATSDRLRGSKDDFGPHQSRDIREHRKKDRAHFESEEEEIKQVDAASCEKSAKTTR